MTEMLQKTENVAKNVANEKLQLLEQVSAFELRDQLQIKDMRISKLKEKNTELRELLKKCRPAVEQLIYSAKIYKLDTTQTEELLIKIDEVLK